MLGCERLLQCEVLRGEVAVEAQSEERQERQALGQRIVDVLLHGSAEEALEALGRLPRPRQVGQH